MIELHTAATPNGWKVSIALEEMGLAYQVHALKLNQGKQRQPEYRSVNPNGKIPAIVDTDNANFRVFESGAILIYLAEQSGKLLPQNRNGRSEVMQWLMLQMGGLGPSQGLAVEFTRFFPEKLPAVIDKFMSETIRLYGVLDRQLADRDFLTGELSIADIAHWAWVHRYPFLNIDLSPLPHLKAWVDRLAQRPAFQRGIAIP